MSDLLLQHLGLWIDCSIHMQLPRGRTWREGKDGTRLDFWL